MKKIIALALTVCLLLGAVQALSDSLYIFPTSDRERLTWEQVEKWDNEALHIAFNEIWARYGYTFRKGGACDRWFSRQPWYQPGIYGSNEAAIARASKIEWDNYHLIKAVMESKRQKKEANKGQHLVMPESLERLSGFEFVKLDAGQKIPVYSAPAAGAWRGANGRATVDTNGAVYAYAQENGWMMIMYETNASSNYVRVGWIDMADIRGARPSLSDAGFVYREMQLTESVSVTDDPLGESTMQVIPAGSKVTYLLSFSSSKGLWDYIAFDIGGQQARGFIHSGALMLEETADFEQPAN